MPEMVLSPSLKRAKNTSIPPIPPKPQITELGSEVPMESSLEYRKNSEKCWNIKLIKNLLIWTKVSLGFRSASRGLGRAVDFLPALPSCRHQRCPIFKHLMPLRKIETWLPWDWPSHRRVVGDLHCGSIILRLPKILFLKTCIFLNYF